MSKWYRSNFTGKIVKATQLNTLSLIYGADYVKLSIEDGLLTPIEQPSVVDILMDNGSIVFAIARYRDIHKCSLRTAKKMVDQINRDIVKSKKKSYGF